MPRGKKNTEKARQQAGTSATQEQGLTKMEAMRRSLGELGLDAKPLQLKAHLKSKYGINMDTSVISSYKGTLKNKMGKRGPGRPKKARQTAGSSANGSSGSLSVADIQAVKAVVSKLGPDTVRELVDVLGK
jgi:hypothetical protein